jgi:hypothetical protein
LRYVFKAGLCRAVKQAEAAGASVKDSELKGIAFGKILDALLGPGSEVREHRAGARKTRAAEKVITQQAGARGPKGYIERLIDDGFFKTPRTLAAVRAELGNGGRERRLRRPKATDGNKQVFTNSNW